MKNLNEGIVAIAGCSAVIAGLYITRDANCLWGLVLVMWMLNNTSSAK